MNRLHTLLTFLFLITATFCFGQQLDKFESTIVEYEEIDKTNGYHQDAILFTGSSSIRMWKSLSQDMAPMKVINRGFGGSTIPEVTYYADRIIKPHQPKAIVFYCGENDLSNDQSKSKLALQSFKKFSKYMRKNLPDTDVYFIAIKPSIRRWNYWPKLEDANKKIKKYIEQKDNYYFLDIATQMLDRNGVVQQDIFIKDNLHMNAKGYEIWTNLIKPLLDENY